MREVSPSLRKGKNEQKENKQTNKQKQTNPLWDLPINCVWVRLHKLPHLLNPSLLTSINHLLFHLVEKKKKKNQKEIKEKNKKKIVVWFCCLVLLFGVGQKQNSPKILDCGKLRSLLARIQRFSFCLIWAIK